MTSILKLSPATSLWSICPLVGYNFEGFSVSPWILCSSIVRCLLRLKIHRYTCSQWQKVLQVFVCAFFVSVQPSGKTPFRTSGFMNVDQARNHKQMEQMEQQVVTLLFASTWLQWHEWYVPHSLLSLARFTVLNLCALFNLSACVWSQRSVAACFCWGHVSPDLWPPWPMLQDFRSADLSCGHWPSPAEDFSSAIAPTFQDALKEGPEVGRMCWTHNAFQTCTKIHEMPWKETVCRLPSSTGMANMAISSRLWCAEWGLALQKAQCCSAYYVLSFLVPVSVAQFV